MSIEAMKQALEAFEWNLHTDLNDIRACEQWAKMLKKNITTLRAAIDQAEKQEPRQWVGLTDEEVHEAFCHVEYETPNDWNTDPDDWCQQFARYIDARLKEKNT